MKNPLSQKILFLQVKNQDPEAYGRFYDLYAERIYRFVFFKVNSAPDAQDIASEVFLKVWQYIKEGKEIKNLHSFVYWVARNSVVDFYRQKSRRTELEEPEGGTEIIDEKQDLMGQQMVDSDMRGVSYAISGLKDEYKEVIILKFLDELSVGEIATVLGKSRGAVRVLIHRATKALKDNLNSAESAPRSGEGEEKSAL